MISSLIFLLYLYLHPLPPSPVSLCWIFVNGKLLRAGTCPMLHSMLKFHVQQWCFTNNLVAKQQPCKVSKICLILQMRNGDEFRSFFHFPSPWDCALCTPYLPFPAPPLLQASKIANSFTKWGLSTLLLFPNFFFIPLYLYTCIYVSLNSRPEGSNVASELTGWSYYLPDMKLNSQNTPWRAIRVTS